VHEDHAQLSILFNAAYSGFLTEMRWNAPSHHRPRAHVYSNAYGWLRWAPSYH